MLAAPELVRLLGGHGEQNPSPCLDLKVPELQAKERKSRILFFCLFVLLAHSMQSNPFHLGIVKYEGAQVLNCIFVWHC